ncbi:MAG: hypothetical protein ACYTFG_00940 [Planctomycetota bacterium]|jgi:hypothetical protein
MRKSLIFLTLPLVLGALPCSARAGEKKTPSTYEALKSILRSRKGRLTSPRPQGLRDPDLIEPDKGAGGVLFGYSLDEVMTIWGKPSAVSIGRRGETWDFSFGATRFKFLDNRLVSISIHNVDLPGARFANGIDFDSQPEDLEKAFGKPIRANQSVLHFSTPGGGDLRCHFVRSFRDKERVKLIVVGITQPESAVSDVDGAQSSPSHDLLKSLVRKRRRWIREVPLEAGDRDPNLVEPEKGAGAVRFGQSLDEVIRVWGRPTSINISPHQETWEFWIRASRFEFEDNKLVTIDIHSVDLEGAFLKNGISFKSSPEDVKKIFGKPIEKGKGTLLFETENGFRIEFHFIMDGVLEGKPEMIAMGIMHPGFA